MAKLSNTATANQVAFGQLGSVYATTADAIQPPTDKVFVAITMLEDCTFDATGGLVAEDENTFINTDHAANDLSSPSADEGSGGVEVPQTQTFPKGLTIYGRWTEVDLTSGTCIAYIG